MNGSNLSAAAAAVVRRLVLVRWLALLARTSLATFGVLSLAAVMCTLATSARPGPLWAAASVLVWLGITAGWAWFKRPAPMGALAAWDERAGRYEMFASAYVFAQQTAHTPGEQLHLRRARGVLEQELPGLSRQIPLGWRHRVWVGPLVLLLATVAAGFWHPATASVPVATVSNQSRQRAKDVAATLAEKARALGPLPGLDKAESKQLEALKQSLDEAAKTLPNLDSATPRKMLGELEQRARAAESLAESLGDADAEKLSAEMLGEMERHADTADLAAALRADDAEQIAAEAQKLADQLADPSLSQEQRQRVATAFKKSLAAANDKDRKSALGKQLADVQQQLAKKQAAGASKRLRDLAQSMTRRKQRQRSSQQLQQLARNLRRAGQQIFGNRSSGLQQLAQNQPPGAQGLQRAGNPRPIPLNQLMAGVPPQPGAGQQNPGQPGAAQAGQTGSAQAPPRAGSQQGAASTPTPGGPSGNAAQPGAAGQPVPGAQAAGATPGAQSAGGAAPVPGSAPVPRPSAGPSPSPGSLAAIPIPGTQPTGMPGSGGVNGPPGAGQPGAGQPGAGQPGAAQPGAAQPGAGQAGAGQPGSTAGGLTAGTGSAPLGNSPVAPFKAARQGVVAAQVGAEGASRSQAIDSLPHEEQALQNPRRQAIEFIKVEEQALADDPLPAGRREQVRRYFDSLRKQLSTVEPSTEPKK